MSLYLDLGILFKMTSTADKVCLNHTNTPAVSRCLTCFKPLCQVCIVDKNGEHFCSELCAAKHESTNPGIQEFEDEERARRFKSTIKKVAIFIIIMALGAGGYYYWTNNKADVKKNVDQIKSKASELESVVFHGK